MKVMKFGGSVLHHEAGFQAMVDIVKRQDDKHVIVISAFSDITRKLSSMMHSVLHTSYDIAISELHSIIQYHQMLSDTLLLDNTVFQELLKKVSILLQRLVKGISLTKEISPRISDLILAQGEILATCFVKELLSSHELNVGIIDAGDIIITNELHGSAKPIEALVLHHVHTTLVPAFDDHDFIIIAGFIGKNSHGDITTMGYESSNLTAALLGSTLKAEEITIWTDVCGIRSSDPKHIVNTIAIPRLSYMQAQELANNGLKLLHHWMLDLPLKHSIPVSIANAFNDEGEKTRISNDFDEVVPTIIIRYSQEILRYSQLYSDDDKAIIQISIFTQNDNVIQKIYALASELSVNERIIIKTFESRNMHHVIIPDHISQYFMNSLHTLIEYENETSS
jgi:aspartate kinase